MRGIGKVEPEKCTSLGLDSHWLGGFLRVSSVAGRVVIASPCPMVILPASLTRRTAAAMIQKQAGHFWATGSSFLDKQAAGLFYDPKVWVSTPFAVPSL